MKKLILIFALFGLILSLHAQLQVPAIASSVQTGTSYCTQYQAVYDEFTTPPNATNAGYQNTMVKGLVDGGYWTGRIDLFYCMAQQSNGANEADINWADPSTGTYDLTETGAGSLTFTSNEGYTGDGTNYLTTAWNASTDASNFTQDDATTAIYCRVDVSESTCAIGVRDGSNYEISILPDYNNSTLYTRVNSGNAIVGTSTDTRGFWMSTRRSSTDVEIYRNGSNFDDDSQLSEALPNDDLDILARSGSLQSTTQVSIVIVMDGVSDAEAAAINTIIEAYMDAIGKGIEP